jgi:hypothetical protein
MHPNVSNGRIRLVYINEAHVSDEWPLNHLTVATRTDDERERFTRATSMRSDVDWLIDTSGLAQLLGAWPELLVVTVGGRMISRVRNVTDAHLDGI